MKTLSNLITMMLIGVTGLAQQKGETMDLLTQTRQIQEAVTSLFVGTDERNWQKVENAFANDVLLDYTSMAGGDPATLTPQQITESWKAILPGFEHTQHAISNFEISVDGDEAQVHHYGNAQHYLKTDTGDNLWTVVGTYDHRLIKTEKGWKVDQMKFDLKYMDGNMDLPRLAREVLQKN